MHSVGDAFQRQRRRISIIGGIDVDFLCRAAEFEIRNRVRETLEACAGSGPGKGCCPGTGNTAANHIPVNNWLIMLEEGRRCRL